MRRFPLRRSIATVASIAATSMLIACGSTDSNGTATAATAPTATAVTATAVPAEPAVPTEPTVPAEPSVPTEPTAGVGTATVAVPELLDFAAPLVGGGEFSGSDVAGTPIAFWFWAPT